MISVKFISDNPDQDSDTPDQLIVEGKEVLFNTNQEEGTTEVIIVEETGFRPSFSCWIGPDPTMFDRAFVMNESGNTISVIKKNHR